MKTTSKKEVEYVKPLPPENNYTLVPDEGLVKTFIVSFLIALVISVILLGL